MYIVLQVIISLIVIYLAFSTLLNVIVEIISTVGRRRSKLLKEAVFNLFPADPANAGSVTDAKAFADAVYNHSRIKSLKSPDGRDPDYIPAKSIATAMIELVTSTADLKGDTTLEKFKAAVQKVNSADLKKLLTTFSQTAQDDEKLSLAIEKWYDDSMDRVTGWFQRLTRKFIIGTAIVLTVGFNVDTLNIIRRARNEPELRQRLNDLGDRLLTDSTFAQAMETTSPDNDYYEDYVNDASVGNPDSVMAETQDHAGPVNKDLKDKIDQLMYVTKLIQDNDLPVWWDGKEPPWKWDLRTWCLTLFGYLLTVIALCAGAPFWFDLLKNFVNIRGSGPRPTVTSTTKA